MKKRDFQTIDRDQGRSPVGSGTVLALALLLMAVPIQSQNLNPGIVPPQAHAHGMTYAEWSARWWQWFLSLPSTSNPVADCSVGQLGSVWFLVGVPGPTTINCTVPNGKALLFPIINTECSNLESPPFFGATEADRRVCARSIVDGAADLAVTVDGRSIQNLTNYRFSSPNFMFTSPPSSLSGVPAGSGESVGDGFYLMLVPLSTGTHIIHFTGSFPAFSFTIDTTYNLTVR
jgi:hypothetical protein